MNRGYQNDDSRILDYSLWSVNGLFLRGPKPQLNDSYFSAIGAAQTFGRFVKRPYPLLISESCGIQNCNLGISGAGPSFFLMNPELIDIVNKGKFVIVQIMSGRSVENSVLSLGVNQGTCMQRYNRDTKSRFAENVYQDLIKSLPKRQLEIIRDENRARLIGETIELLRKIEVPKILLYWSTRNLDYKEETNTIAGYWGGFPHFVNSGVVGRIAEFADCSVNVVGSEGLPQDLYDSRTGEPVLMWNEAQFPNIKHRYSNLYYPSPQMHLQAAEALRPFCDKFA